MNLLVCISRTPETTAKIAFTDGGSQFDTTNVKYILNPYDEWYALVRALELKEATGGTVTVIHVGPKTNETEIRKALAIGADKAVRIDTEATSSQQVARQIAAYADGKNYDIIFLGKETINFNQGETGGMVAELMDLPYISYVVKMEVADNTATVTRDIEGGTETIEVATPFVLSAAKGLAEQRIPNMRGIMMAKRKPMEVVEPADFSDPVEIVHYELPPPKKDVQMIDPENMDELVRLLHEEAKVI